MADGSYSASHLLTAADLAAGPPVIDVSALLTSDSVDAGSDVVKQINKAATSWGFFQVVNHGVDPDLRARADERSIPGHHNACEL